RCPANTANWIPAAVVLLRYFEGVHQPGNNYFFKDARLRPCDVEERPFKAPHMRFETNRALQFAETLFLGRVLKGSGFQPRRNSSKITVGFSRGGELLGSEGFFNNLLSPFTGNQITDEVNHVPVPHRGEFFTAPLRP